MVRSAPSRRRAPVEWAFRGFLSIGAAWLGYVATSQSLANSMKASAVERAHALAPGNGRITARLSSWMMQSDPSSASNLARAEAMAREALHQDASAVEAVATLALVRQAQGDGAAARSLLAYSDRLSRRDLSTRLALIEQAVARGDVPETLRNYDIALRTSKSASDILFPVLSTAIEDAAIRTQIVRVLATVPPWGGGFISHVTTLGPNVNATAALLQDLHRRGIATPSDATAIIVDRLIAQNRGLAAWSYYATMTPGANRQRSRDSSFDKAPVVASAFDWRLLEDSGITASIQQDSEGSFFDFSAAASVGGPVLRQAQALRPGNYLLEGQSTGIEQPESSLPYWVLTCLSGRELGRVTIPNSSQDSGRFSGRIMVPADCPVQQLTLMTQGSDQVNGTIGQIRRIAITVDGAVRVD